MRRTPKNRTRASRRDLGVCHAACSRRSHGDRVGERARGVLPRAAALHQKQQPDAEKQEALALVMSFSKTVVVTLLVTLALGQATRAAGDSIVKQFTGSDFPCPSGPTDVDRLSELNPDALKLLVALTNGACKYAAGDYSGSLAILLPEAQLLGETVTANVAGEYQARIYWLLANVETKMGDAHKAAHYMAVAWAVDKGSHSMLSDLTPEFVQDHKRVTETGSIAAIPESTRTASPELLSQLASDPVVKSCSAAASGSKLGGLFECVYIKGDYKTAEALGEALLANNKSATQKTIYEVANAFYQRGNNPKALQYAKLGYSELLVSDKANCDRSLRYCAQLRGLLVKLDPSYRAKFIAEDQQIKAQAAAAAHQAADAARQAAATALDISGSGTHSTETFTVNNEWELDWSYDCSSFGSQGNFQIYIYTGRTLLGVGVNQLGDSDSGTEYLHQGGDIYLEINSECNWSVKALNR